MARVINNEYLFIHSAKTGGTFLRETVNRYGIPNYEVCKKHSSYKDVIKEYPHFKELKSFGYIRNPISWYRSRWAYGMMTYFGDKIKFMPEAYKHWMAPVWSNDLNQFVENTLRYYPSGIAFKYFNDMLGIGEDTGRVDFIYRYENLPFTTAVLIKDCKNSYTPVDEFIKMPKILDSSRYKDLISPALQKEIELAEKQLLDMYY